MRDFYNKTKLIYKGIIIHTNKGLFQGSWLSPILFNFYINKLLIDINIEKWKAIALADDIVMMIESKKNLNESLIKLKLCWEGQELMINPKKSGIMRILRMEGKVKEINNILGIPEVKEYKYLRILISQSMKFKGVIWVKKKI